MTNATRVLRVLTFLGGALLVVIGIRFFLIPEQAARIFGIRTAGSGFELHNVIAARDVWLGLLAIGLAWLKEWRALALWFALGFFVCLADAAVVVSSGGKAGPISFHLSGAAMCVVLGWLSVRAAHEAARR